MPFVETSLEYRSQLRKLILGWFKPSVLKEEKYREELNRSLQKHWLDSPIKVYELVHENWDPPPPAGSPVQKNESEHFIVFIDTEFKIDWINNGKGNEIGLECITVAESIGARQCDHLPREQILEFRRLQGQAIVNAIIGNAKQSRSLSELAAQFLKDRTIERSRAWTLASAHCLLVAIGGLAAVCFGSPNPLVLTPGTPTGLCLGAVGGLIGAYLSVIQKAGSGEWDAASGWRIHILEVFTKLTAGTLFGAVAFLISQSVHAPASVKAVTPDSPSIFIFGFAAGFIERVIPKMISSYSESLTNDQPKKLNDKKSNTH